MYVYILLPNLCMYALEVSVYTFFVCKNLPVQT